MSPLELILAALLGGSGGYGLAQLRHGRRQRTLESDLQVQQRHLQGHLTRIEGLEREHNHLRGRLGLQDGMISELSDHRELTNERITQLVAATLSLGNELKGQVSELDAALDAMSAQQQVMLTSLDGQLQEMQAFIVRAAEQAAEQRAALKAAPVAVPPVAVPPVAVPSVAMSAAPASALTEAELQQLLSKQQVLQQQFAQRRRAESAASFPNLNGAGL